MVKQRIKRPLALLLVLVMVLTMLPTVVLPQVARAEEIPPLGKSQTITVTVDGGTVQYVFGNTAGQITKYIGVDTKDGGGNSASGDYSVIPDGILIVPHTITGTDSALSETVTVRITSLGQYVFANNDSIRTVILEEGIESIESYAFKQRDTTGAGTLTAMVLPDSLKTAKTSALQGHNIDEIVIGRNFTTISGAPPFTGGKGFCKAIVLAPLSLDKQG